jgi:hypothetical protein
MKYTHFSMLPEDAFQHCGNGKIRLHGDVENFFENPLGTVEDALGSLDDWVREEIPMGWVLPAAIVAWMYGVPVTGAEVGTGAAAGGTAAAGTMTAAEINAMLAAEQAASVTGGVTAGTAAATTGAAGAMTAAQVAAANTAAAAASGAYGSTVASLVSAGVPASIAMALPSVSTLASNAAVNAAMQMATTGKVNVDSLVKSLAMGSVSSVAGAAVSSAVGSAGIEDKLLQSIANSAAQGATGAVLSGRNPITAALASALAGGVGYATQSSGLTQTAINSTINSLASGQSVQNALVSAAMSVGGNVAKGYAKGFFDDASVAAKEYGATIKNYIKGFFDDVGVANGAQKGEGAQAFDAMYNAKTEAIDYLNVNLDKLNEIEVNKKILEEPENVALLDAFKQQQDEYTGFKNSYERLIDPVKYAASLGMQYDPKTDELWNISWSYVPPGGEELNKGENPGDRLVFGTWAEKSAENKQILPIVIGNVNSSVGKLNDFYTNSGVAPLIDLSNKINENAQIITTGYNALSKAANTAEQTFNKIIPADKTGDFLSTYTPAPDQGGVPEAPPVEVPPEEPVTPPEGCQPPFVDDGTGRCILPEDKAAEDTPDCGPGMAFSLATNSCVPVDDMTKPVTTTVTPKTPGSTGTTGGTGTTGVPTKPVVTAPAVNSGQTQQNQQNALLMGLLLGEVQQAPQQQQPVLAKIGKAYDFEEDILGGADYLKATQQPYAAGGSVHAINDELIKMLRS